MQINNCYIENYIVKYICMNNSDIEKLNRLIVAVAAGHVDCLDGIYSLAGGRMLAVALNTVGKEYAQDIVHDAFIKVVRFASKYKSGSNPYAWLCKIVKNTGMDFLRQNKVIVDIDSDNILGLSALSYSNENLDNALTLESALSKLEKVERQVIYYTYYMDMTVREIATELKLSKSAVCRIKESAQKKLKNLLKGGTND